jgi:hypothetical protein
MEALGVILLLELVIGVLIAHGARGRYLTPALQQRDIILPEGSLFFLAAARSVEPVAVSHFRRTCGCKQIGCTM